MSHFFCGSFLMSLLVILAAMPWTFSSIIHTHTHTPPTQTHAHSWITWVTRFTALTSCHPVGGAVHYCDRLDFLKILFHIRPERLERDRCCQGVMDEPLLKGHQGNNRQLSEPWKQRAKPEQSTLPLSSPQLSDWKMSAIRKYGNVKVVSR